MEQHRAIKLHNNQLISDLESRWSWKKGFKWTYLGDSVMTGGGGGGLSLFQFWLFPSAHAQKCYFVRECYRWNIRDSLQASFFGEGSIAPSRNWNYCSFKDLLGQSTGKSSKVEVSVHGELPPGGTSGCSTHQWSLGVCVQSKWTLMGFSEFHFGLILENNDIWKCLSTISTVGCIPGHW